MKWKKPLVPDRFQASMCLPLCCLLVSVCLLVSCTDSPADPPATVQPLNVPLPTLGGAQFWSDELIQGDWRIQRNVLTEHYRLIDPHNTRRAWGSWDVCREQWEEIRSEQALPATRKKVILVLHGLIRTRRSMANMAEFLEQDPEYSVFNLSYASTRESIRQHAQSLARVVAHLEEAEQIDFVAHSLGNLVIRHFLADQLRATDGRHIDPRIHRIVMLGPPNQGAELARRFQDNRLFRTLFGNSGQQLGETWDQLAKQLAVPPCPFGIIAGREQITEGGNPIIPGDDDMVVSVAETRLAGARDFVVVPCLHTKIMDDPTVQQYTRNFLRHGYFISEQRRQPLPTVLPDEKMQP